MSRKDNPTCAVCETFPAIRRIGFPHHPHTQPGLPEALRGKSLPVCEAPACDQTARARAVVAAARAGFVLAEIFIETL